MDQAGTPRTVELASSILATVTELEKYLEDNSLPTPSLQPENVNHSPTLPPSLSASVDEALGQIEQLTALLLGPLRCLTSQLGRALDVSTMHAIYRYKIPQKFDVGEIVTVAELARRCNADEETFTRLVQHAVAFGSFLAQPRPGHVAHTAFSAMLASSPQIFDLVGFFCEDTVPAILHLPMAMTAIRPGEPLPDDTGHNLATGKSGTFWEILADDPDRLKRFTACMTLRQQMPDSDPAAALEPEVFDWAALKPDATVVDIGGGNGTFAFALAARHPDLRRIVVQDLPSVVELARSTVPDHLRTRVEFQAHNFLSVQPERGAAVYFLRKILHDWSDEFAIKILKQLIPALETGSRVLINEIVVPSPGTLSPYQEWDFRGQDLIMMAFFNGKERSLAQWEDLVTRASARFHLTAVKTMPPGPLALLELVWT